MTTDADRFALADLIGSFLDVAFKPESLPSLRAAAQDVDASLEQFLAMSLTHLITERFDLTPRPEAEPADDEAASEGSAEIDG